MQLYHAKQHILNMFYNVQTTGLIFLGKNCVSQ